MLLLALMQSIVACRIGDFVHCERDGADGRPKIYTAAAANQMTKL